MPDIAIVVAIALGALAFLIAILGWLRSRTPDNMPPLTREQVAELFRGEHDRLRDSLDGQFRTAREELAGRLDAGIAKVEGQARETHKKLDIELEKMASEATENRDRLRIAIEERLEKAATTQVEAAKGARIALLQAVIDQGKATTDLLAQIGDHQKERLSRTASEQAEASKEGRITLLQAITDQGRATTDMLTKIGELQKERLENVAAALTELTKQQGEKLDAVRLAVQERLDAMRNENSAKLDEMRLTVDEKLHATLETRLGESFNRVVEQLKLVSEGIGEMKSLASGVGDLKKVLSNVSVRGVLGEIQLSRLLEQILSPEQYIENAAVTDDSQERVEFAIRLPGQNGDNEVLLPIDAKFPQEDYQRLLEAAEIGDSDGVAAAATALEARIRQFAETIQSKYIVPPRTTDFAILFLPTEGLYAEVLRRPGLFERLQHEQHVTLAGPTTLTALLNALQMGFRSVAIQKRSSEVWQVLGAVRTEFGKYNAVVDKLGKQLGTAANSVHELGRRTRAMGRRLREVETLPIPEAETMLGFNGDGTIDHEDADETQEAWPGRDRTPIQPTDLA